MSRGISPSRVNAQVAAHASAAQKWHESIRSAWLGAICAVVDRKADLARETRAREGLAQHAPPTGGALGIGLRGTAGDACDCLQAPPPTVATQGGGAMIPVISTGTRETAREWTPPLRLP